MNIVTDKDGLILMISTAFPEPPEGGALHILTGEQEAARELAFAQPNGGVRFDGVTFTPLSFVPPPRPAIMCSKWQFRKELRERGIRDAVFALIAQQDEEVQEAFDCVSEFWSNNSLLLALASQLPTPLSEDQVYDMIASASKRVVAVP